MSTQSDFQTKLVDDYLRRYEDQTLKAMESHSNAFGQTLVAAYLLYPAELLINEAPKLEGLRPLLMAALYLYMTYHMKVLGSLAKDVLKNSNRIREFHQRTWMEPAETLHLIHMDSNRIKLAGPLGPLQLTSIKMAWKIALSMNYWTFWIWVVAGIVVLLLIMAVVLYPLIGLFSGLSEWWPATVLLPGFYAAKLFFRFPRPLIKLTEQRIKDSAERFRLRRWFMSGYSWLIQRVDDDEQDKQADPDCQSKGESTTS